MNHVFYMHQALIEADKDDPPTWQNPRVGAVIVNADRILAAGHHERFGGPHAEINALNHLANRKMAAGATLYVSLEPCAHIGKTPPCVEAIVAAGIKSVVIGEIDPNPLVAGKGVQSLRDHGVTVTVLSMPLPSNAAYRFYHQHHQPLVTLKYASTADGRINFDHLDRSLLTGQPAFQDSQQLRHTQQAILVGANTARFDDPQLTVRNSATPFPPIRIVITHDAAQLPKQLNLLSADNNEAPVWLLTTKPFLQSLPAHVRVVVRPTWDPVSIKHYLAQQGIQSLLVEGGSQLLNQFVRSAAFDRLVVYVAPQLFGSQALPILTGDALLQPLSLRLEAVTRLADDVKLIFERSR